MRSGWQTEVVQVPSCCKQPSRVVSHHPKGSVASGAQKSTNTASTACSAWAARVVVVNDKRNAPPSRAVWNRFHDVHTTDTACWVIYQRLPHMNWDIMGTQPPMHSSDRLAAGSTDIRTNPVPVPTTTTQGTSIFQCFVSFTFSSALCRAIFSSVGEQPVEPLPTVEALTLRIGTSRRSAIRKICPRSWTPVLRTLAAQTTRWLLSCRSRAMRSLDGGARHSSQCSALWAAVFVSAS